MSIREAASALGKSPRTVRDMAARGRLPARRVGGRWIVDGAAALAGDAGQAARERREAEVERLRNHVTTALDEVDAGRRGFYSVRDITAFDVMSQVRHALEQDACDVPAHGAALAALRDAMHRLAEGFHQYQVAHKIERLILARDRCCSAIAELTHLGRQLGHPGALDHASRLERDGLGSLRGLLRRAERRAGGPEARSTGPGT